MTQVKYSNNHFNLADFFNAAANAHKNDIKIGQPDTQNSFDIKFRFYPYDGDGMNIEQTQSSIQSKLADELKTNSNALKANQGLVSSSDTFRRDGDRSQITSIDHNSVIIAHDSFKTCKSATSSSSFIEYLLQANKLIGVTKSWKNSNDTTIAGANINMTYFVQDLTIPNIKSNGDGECVTPYLGSFPINGTFVTPAEHKMSLNILNTRVPLIERVFYPWLRETTLPYWSYTTQPFTTATIEIDMRHHTDVRYIFYGCRPCEITTLQPSQDTPSDFVRQVTFAFDWMFILSDLTVGDYDISVKNNVAAKSLDDNIAIEKQKEQELQNNVKQWANIKAQDDANKVAETQKSQQKMIDDAERQRKLKEQQELNDKQKAEFDQAAHEKRY